MKIRGVLTDEDALSPVIGVVLMVAVTVVLSAAVGAFVLDIGSKATQESPNAVVQYEFDVDGTGNETLTLSHEGGNNLDGQHVTVYVGGQVAWSGGTVRSPYVLNDTDEWADTIEGGDSLSLETDTSNVAAGDEVQIVWQDGEQSTILGERAVA